MSAPSGIKVPDDLKSAFSKAMSDASDVRALVFIIEGGTFSVNRRARVAPFLSGLHHQPVAFNTEPGAR